MKVFVISFLFVSSSALAGVQSLSQATKKTHAKGAVVRFLASSKIHKNKDAFIGHLTIPPGGKVPLHQDKTEEYIFILEGEGTIWIDGQKSKVKKDDLIFMEAMAKVRFENGPKVLKGLQVFAPQGPESKYDSWGTPMKPSVKTK